MNRCNVSCFHSSANKRTVFKTQQQQSHSDPIELVTAEQLYKALEYLAEFRLKSYSGLEESPAIRDLYLAAFAAVNGLPTYQWRRVRVISKSASKVRCSRDFVL